MTTHDLKTWPEYFGPVWDLRKTFEIRYDDRAFQPGDTVVLREFDPRGSCSCITRSHAFVEHCARYSGRVVTATIGHLTSSTPARGSQRGFRGDGYVVFSLCDITRGGVGKDPGPQDAPDSSDAPSPVSDESLPSEERPAATSRWMPEARVCDPAPSPAVLADRQRRARARAVLEARGDEHIPNSAPRLAYSSTPGEIRKEIDGALVDVAHATRSKAQR